MSLRPAREPLEALSDEDLMTRIQSDNLGAFEELYYRHSAKAFGLARFICRNFQPAEEATQDSFLTVWRSRVTYDPDSGSACAWLMAVVRHRSIDVMRCSGRNDRHWGTRGTARRHPSIRLGRWGRRETGRGSSAARRPCWTFPSPNEN